LVSIISSIAGGRLKEILGSRVLDRIFELNLGRVIHPVYDLNIEESAAVSIDVGKMLRVGVVLDAAELLGRRNGIPSDLWGRGKPTSFEVKKIPLNYDL